MVAETIPQLREDRSVGIGSGHTGDDRTGARGSAVLVLDDDALLTHLEFEGCGSSSTSAVGRRAALRHVTNPPDAPIDPFGGALTYSDASPPSDHRPLVASDRDVDVDTGPRPSPKEHEAR
jgi:hypothetical protein